MVAWTLIYRELPFESFNTEAFIENVVNNKLRSRLTSRIPVHISNLLERCWSENIEMRPNFEEISNILDFTRSYLESVQAIKNQKIYEKSDCILSTVLNWLIGVPAMCTPLATGLKRTDSLEFN